MKGRQRMNDKIDDIGIYTDIHESGKRNKDGNKMYYATCKVCGTIVEKKLANIKRSNKICCHKTQKNNLNKINDMPVGWINKSDLNKKFMIRGKECGIEQLKNVVGNTLLT